MASNRGLSFGHKRSEAPTLEFANNRAYVIGINAYSNGIPPLRTAVADAERLGTVLAESHSYTVRVFPRAAEPTLVNLRELLNVTLPQEIGANDRVLLYFAGHGIACDGEDGPEGYLVPVDANREERTSLLPMTELNEALAKLPCRHLLLILDCCFAGAFRWSSTRDLSTLPSVIHRERYERYIQDPAWQVLTSAAYDQMALDVLSGSTIGERIETADHSPFASALFRALEGDADLIPRGKAGQPGGDGVITATELYLYLRECVETATVERRTRQTPGLWPLKRHDKGEYILLSPGHELNLPPAPELNEANNPYRGLQSFDEEHAPLFFGRSKFVAALAERVQAQSLTIVLGASGTGKSSVVKAGLLPFVRFRENDAWHIVPPFRPGKSPLAALAALTLPGESSDPDTIASRLNAASSDATAFAHRVATWAATTSPLARLLIVVDQFEELLTLCWDAAEREQFLVQLDRALAACPDRLRIVVTLRSDFEPQFAHSPLQEEWLGARIVVPVMTLDEYREAIEGPASVKVLYFQGRASSQAFIDRLIGDVANTPGALPLLSFSLSELYRRYLARRDDDRSLREDDYEALGGVGGSLRNRADEVYTGLPSDEHRATMKRVMLRMVSVEGGELARRRVPDEEIVYESPEENKRVQEIVRRLTEARLVVEGKETDGQPYIEPAHDELIRGWEKLLKWSRESQESHQLRRLLTPASNDWKQHRGGLWHANPRLNLVRKALDTNDQWLNRSETEFVRASVARRRKIWIGAVSSVAAAFIILSVITVFALVQRRQANLRRIESINETARLLKIEGEQAQADGHLQSAMHYYAASLERRAEVDETDPVSRLRLGVLSTKAPVVRAIIDCPQRPERIVLGPSARRLLTFSGIEDDPLAPSAWVRLWDAQAGVLLVALKDGNQDRAQAVRFSADGRFLLVLFRFDNRASLWDAEEGKLLHHFDGHTEVVNDAIFGPDEKTVVTSSRDGTARIWDAATGRELRRLSARFGYVYKTRFSPDSRRIATACSDQVRIWDAATGNLLHSLDLERGAIDVEFNHDGSRLVSEPFNIFINRVADEKDYRATLWDVESGRKLHTFSEVTDVDFVSPTGHIFTPQASRAWGRGVRAEGQLWKEQAEAFESVAKYQGRVIATPPKQNYFLMVDDEVLRVLDTDDGAVRNVMVDISMGKVHPKGRLLLTDYSDNTARLWDARSGVMITALEGHSAPVLDVNFDPSGDWIATASADDTVRVWQYQPTAEQDLVGHYGQVTTARFLDDGPLVLTASWKTGWTINDPPVDQTTRLWDSTTGRTVAEIAPPARRKISEVVYDKTNHLVILEWSHIGKSVVTIVNAVDGRAIASIEGQSLVGYSSVDRLIFTSDGSEVVAWNESTGERRYAVTGTLPVDAPQHLTAGRIATIVDNASNPDHYQLLIWDTATGNELGRIERFWSKDRDSSDGKLYPVSWSIEAIQFHPSGRSLAVLGDSSETSKIVDLVLKTITGSLEVPPYLTEDGANRAAALDASRMSSDGRFLITVGNLTSIWDSVTGQRIKELVGAYLEDNADTSRMITLNDGQIYVWNINDWSRARVVRSANDRITIARLSRDGRRLITGSNAGAVELWDLETGANLIRLGSLDAPISVVARDDQGTRVLAGSDTGELKVWTVLPELLQTQELATWIAATAGSHLQEGSEQVAGLASGDWAEQRDAAIRRLGVLLNSGNLQERVAVASAILRLVPSHPAAIETLMLALETADTPLVRRAQASLAMADPTSDGFRHAVASQAEKGRVDDALAATLSRLGAEGLPLLEPLLFRREGLSPHVRANLVAAMKPAGTKAVVLLARAVVDREPLVRITAANLLKDLGADAGPAIPAMIRALGMEGRETRLAVGSALTTVGVVAIPDLIKGLESPAYYIRFNSIAVLNNLRREAHAAVPALIQVALHDEDPTIRLEAANAVAAIDSQEGSGALLMGGDTYTGKLSIPLLKKAMANANVEVGGRCVELLAILRRAQGFGKATTDDLFVTALLNPSSDIRDQAALVLVQHGDSEVLAKVGASVIPHIVKLMKHPESGVRDQAMMELWSLIKWKGDFSKEIARSTQAILEARADNVTAIYAGHALGDLGTLCLPYLIEATFDSSAVIRSEAAFWLGSLQQEAEASLPALDKLLDDSNEKVRLNAAKAILDIKGSTKRVEATLVKSLRSSTEAERRSQAAEAMSGLHDVGDDVVPALAGALKDKTPRVRYESASTLLQLKVEQQLAIATLQQLLLPEAGDGQVSSNAAHRLGEQGDLARGTIPTLRQAVSAFPESYDLNLRMSFVRALNSLQAIDELIDLLAEEPEVSFFHSEIVEDIEKLLAIHPDRLSRVAELLTNEDEDIREFGANLLASLGPASKTAIPALEKATTDPSDSVRSAALAAIKEIRAEELLDADAESTRLEAAETLMARAIHSNRIVDVLAAILEETSDPDLRTRAFQAICKVKDSRKSSVAETISRYLDNEQPRIRYEAADSLLSLGTVTDGAIVTMNGLLTCDSENGRYSAMAAGRLAEVGDVAPEIITRIVEAASAFPEHRQTFIDALGELNAFDALVQMLDETTVGDELDSIFQAIELAVDDDPKAIEKLASLLEDGSASRKVQVIQILGNISGDVTRRLEVLNRFVDDDDDAIKDAARAVIEEINAEEM